MDSIDGVDLSMVRSGMKFFLVMLVFLAGCPAAVCQHLESQCANNVAQICDSHGQWEEIMNCGNVLAVDPLRGSASWTCQEVPDGHACLPTE